MQQSIACPLGRLPGLRLGFLESQAAWSPQSLHWKGASERGTLNESGHPEAQRVPAFRNNQGPDHLRMLSCAYSRVLWTPGKMQTGVRQTWNAALHRGFSPVRGVTSFLAWLEAVSGVHLGCGLGIAMELGTQLSSNQQLHFSEVA